MDVFPDQRRPTTGNQAQFGSLNESQFFAVLRDGDGFSTRGQPRAFIGHRLAAPAGAQPDGAFLEWRWDGARLIVENDRYGLVPAYYALTPRGFSISTSVVRLLDDGVPATLDEDALAVFLRMGTFLGADTAFAAIRALPPGTRYAWHDGAGAPEGRITLGQSEQGLDRDEACRRYGALFRRAVERRSVPSGREAVALSGGMDSRHVLLELCRIGRKPVLAVTARPFRGQPSRDVELAQAVCSAAGVRHRVVERSANWLADESRKNLDTDFCALEHGWGYAVMAGLRGEASAVFDGLAGDVFTDCRGITTPQRLAAFRDGRFTDLAEDFLGPARSRLAYLPVELRQRLSRERAVARFVAECARFAGAPNPPAAFWFWNRTRRTVSLLPYGIWQRAMHVVAPFLDHELFDFMIGLPVGLVADHGLHAETLRREFPEYAAIPTYSAPEPPPDSGWPGFRTGARQALGLALRRHRTSFLARGHVLTRLARALIDTDYCRSVRWLPPSLLYALQIEECTKKPRRAG